MLQRIVIVGAGQAACELAFSLRKEGFSGTITIVGQEAYPPYQRPPLSKAFLAGTASLESLYLRPLSSYDKAGIELRLGASVVSIDRSGKLLHLADGAALAYDKLVLATGGEARQLTGLESVSASVFSLRSIDDILHLRSAFLPDRHLLLIGGGYVGLEVAAVAVAQGLKVTLVENAPRLLARVAAPEISAFYATLHQTRGVDIRLNTSIVTAETASSGVGVSVSLSDGTTVVANMIVVGVGLVPNVTLASAAGLAVDDGIVIDEHTRTSDPDIMAIGDCANHYNAFAGRRMRIESVQNAIEQARVAAANLCGKPDSLSITPWFWSDQYHLKLQMAGLSHGYDQAVMRGQMASESFMCFYLKQGKLIAADAINRPADFMHARRLIGTGRLFHPALLADETIPLKLLAAENKPDAVSL